MGLTSSAATARLRVPGQERVDQHVDVALGQLEAGVAEEADAGHGLGLLRCRDVRELAREAEPDGDADEHADAGLLGQQRAHRGDALLDVAAARRPAATACSWAWPNQPPSASASSSTRWICGAARATRSCGGAQALGVGERLDGRVDLRVRVRAVGHGRHHRHVAVPLTSLSHGAGCGCKIGAAELAPIVAGLPAPADPARAGRRRRPPTTPASTGCATTSRSSTRPTSSRRSSTTPTTSAASRPPTRSRTSTRWAATPVTALNLVAFSLEELGADVLREILRGGADAAAAAGAAVVGGHSIDDREPKYGMAVTGDRASRRAAHQRRRARRRRARADQAGRRRRDHHRAQARARREAELDAAPSR